ncbi:MAG: hypothetical protein M3Z04_10475 [Chloroflexota bacterium]|nr:hypothetical protein [Chloroflexota bacterium]
MSLTWSYRTIGSICRPERAIVDPNSSQARDLPYLGLEHIESLTGEISGPLTATAADNVRSVTYYFDTRHVLYSKLRPYLNKVAVPTFTGRCTTELIPLLPATDICRDFLAWLLRRPETVNAAMQEKTGARMPRTDMRHLLLLKVPVPSSLDDQQQIADELAARFRVIAQAKRSYAEQLQLLDLYAQALLNEFTNFSIAPNESEET